MSQDFCTTSDYAGFARDTGFTRDSRGDADSNFRAESEALETGKRNRKTHKIAASNLNIIGFFMGLNSIYISGDWAICSFAVPVQFRAI